MSQVDISVKPLTVWTQALQLGVRTCLPYAKKEAKRLSSRTASRASLGGIEDGIRAKPRTSKDNGLVSKSPKTSGKSPAKSPKEKASTKDKNRNSKDMSKDKKNKDKNKKDKNKDKDKDKDKDKGKGKDKDKDKGGGGGGGLFSKSSAKYSSSSAKDKKEKDVKDTKPGKEENKEFNDREDYFRYYFPTQGGESNGLTTPEHYFPQGFTMTIYSPASYSSFRKQNKGDREWATTSFVKSLCADGMKEFVTNSASGALFAITGDGKLIVKSASKSEMEFLERILPQYTCYHSQNPDSLIVRILAHFKIKLDAPDKSILTKSKSNHFIIMENVDRSGKPPEKAFDLKGSAFNRRADKNDFVGLDKNFNRVMTMGTSLYSNLMNQFAKDVGFLTSMNIMDYSLYMSIHNYYGADSYDTDEIAKAPPATDKDFAKWLKSFVKCGGLSAVSSPEVFFVGIIDILQQYNTSRKVQTMLQGTFIRQEISVVDPEYYGSRFLNMLKTDIEAIEDDNKKKKCICM